MPTDLPSHASAVGPYRLVLYINISQNYSSHKKLPHRIGEAVHKINKITRKEKDEYRKDA